MFGKGKNYPLVSFRSRKGSFVLLKCQHHFTTIVERRAIMDPKQLKRTLAVLGLAGLLASAGLTLPGCAKHPPAGQTS
jgi:radical SAM modification target selenobiotic family peptide